MKRKKRNERNSSWKHAGGGYGDNVPIQRRALSSFISLNFFLFYFQCSSASTTIRILKELYGICVLVKS
jgi:hypothetical protein